MKIIITGGTGFTGKRVLKAISGKSDLQIRVLTRSEEHFRLIEQNGYEPYLADVKDKNQLKEAMEGFEGLINIVSLGFGDAENIVKSAEEAGIKRALFVSTTAVKTTLKANSKKVRLEAEETIKKSSLNWTIIRPTMIYGGLDDRNIIRFIKFVRKMPFLIIPGSGEFLQQPVHVEDLAKGIVDAFFSENTSYKTYNLSGAFPVSFNQMIQIVSDGLKVKRKVFHFPAEPIIAIFSFLEKILNKPFLKSEQIKRLMEDKSFFHWDAEKDFGFEPRNFIDGVNEEIRLLKKLEQ